MRPVEHVRRGIDLGTEKLSIPKDWGDITPEWMTTALSGHFRDVEVSRVELVMQDDGTNRRARFGIGYSSGTGPPAVFAKAADPAHSDLRGSPKWRRTT